jgi:hypothetical protein
VRPALWLLLPLVGCGGDGSSDDAGTDAPDGTLPVTDTALCDGIPQFNLPGMGCDQIVSALFQTMDAARDCVTVDDCQAVSGQCTSFVDSTCWFPVNTCVDDGTVSQFAAEWSGCPTTNQGCSCGAPPELDCVSGKCTFGATY